MNTYLTAAVIVKVTEVGAAVAVEVAGEHFHPPQQHAALLAGVATIALAIGTGHYGDADGRLGPTPPDRSSS